MGGTRIKKAEEERIKPRKKRKTKKKEKKIK